MRLLMPFLLSLLLLIPGLVPPSEASRAITPDELVAAVQSTGCTAPVYVIDQDDPNGAFGMNPWTGQTYVALFGLTRLPREWALNVAYHEAGHCLQYQSGEIFTLRAPELEWDADRLALRFLERDGLDGGDIARQWWAYINQRYRYSGHAASPHGLLTHRLTRIALNQGAPRVESV